MLHHPTSPLSYIAKNFKWNPHLYKLYGYGFCKGKNPPPKIAGYKVEETLYLKVPETCWWFNGGLGSGNSPNMPQHPSTFKCWWSWGRYHSNIGGPLVIPRSQTTRQPGTQEGPKTHRCLLSHVQWIEKFGMLSCFFFGGVPPKKKNISKASIVFGSRLLDQTIRDFRSLGWIFTNGKKFALKLDFYPFYRPRHPGEYCWWFRNPANHLTCMKPCK